jgi:hypothetical protein
MGFMPLVIIPNVPAWQVALFGCNLLAFVALFVRIVSIRVAKSCPALALWVAVNCLLSLMPWIVRMDFLFYYWFFICAESVELVLYLFTVLELYGKVLKSFPGLASTARTFIQVVVPASALGGVSLLAFAKHPVSRLDWYYRADGAVISAVVFFVLMITAFMVWFPIRVSRNTCTYSVGYAAYLVPKGAGMFLMNLGYGGTSLGGVVGMPVSILCLLFWAVALRRDGEKAMVSPGSRFHQRDEARLMTQLEAINRVLAGAAPK